VIGGVAGALAWVLPGVGPVLGTGIWAATGGGAIAGTVVGGMVGAIDATQLGPEWEVTYGAPLRDGKVLVAVHARDEAAAATAVEVLEGLGPDRIDHLNEDGKPLEEASEGS
jgi:outer membrane lipoprotein SlyB